MKISESTNKFEALYDKVRALGTFGANSVHRRILSLLASELNIPDGAGTRCRPDVDGCRPDHCRRGSFAFADAVAEVREDDRRRSVLLDPEEALASHLVDLYVGRLDVLEARSVSREVQTRAQAKAIDYIRNHYPIVTINRVAARSDHEVVESLRVLLHDCERRLKEGRAIAESERGIYELHGVLREECQHISTESGATRWLENGTILQKLFREVYTCIDKDACCGNGAYTKYGNWDWREVWRDTGKPNQPPPTPPPDFVPYPWDNHCKVFPSPVDGRVTSDYGWRNINGETKFHQGIDVAVGVGTTVVAYAAGTVVHLNFSGAEGGVILRDGDRISQYWHIDPRAGLKVGDRIEADGVVGTVAYRPDGPHLHWAVYDPPGGDWTKKSPENSLDPCP